MVRVKIYVEGGGDSNSLRTKCHRGFAEFFRKAGLEGRMPRIVACGSRNDAYDSFCTAISQARSDDFPLLLVDSEAPVAEHCGAWTRLRARDKWERPATAREEQAHLMVQCMEAWLVADRECLTMFYGQGFHENALPQRNDVEEIPKTALFAALKSATRHTRTKGEYDKGDHSFDLLALADPQRVQAAAPRAAELLTTLVRIAENGVGPG